MRGGKIMGSKNFFSLGSIKAQKDLPGGSLTHVTSDQAPGFVNISFASLTLKNHGALEPIWHPNANKIGYCVQGKAKISLRTADKMSDFEVKAGEVFFIPKGAIHDVVNNNTQETNIVFAFDNTKPEVMCLSKAINSLSDSVFASTFNSAPDFFQGLKKNPKSELIKTLQNGTTPTPDTTSPYKFNIAASDKPILTKGGYLQLATKPNLPVLEGLGILGFGLNRKGVVEPHWHTNAGELVYIVKGRTRITVLAPDGTIDVMEVKGGEGAFAAASHFHNIENIGDENVEVIAFFSNAEPDYIGIGEAVGAFSNDVLGSVFNVSPSYFDAIKKPETPLIIVPI